MMAPHLINTLYLLISDEFDFRTTCLARDLRDGVRLSRLVDLLLSVSRP